MKQVKAFLFSKKIIANDVYHLFFHVEDGGFEFKPGEYAILTIPSSPSPLKRLYSFAGSNLDKNTFELLIKLVPGGVASEYIRSLVIGDKIDISGPAGLFLQQKTELKKIYMTTGTGFAPIRSFLLSGPSQALNSLLFWGMRDLSEVYLFDELLSLKKISPSFSFYYCLSQQSSFDIIPADLLQYFRTGHIDAVWSSLMPTIDKNDEYYLCGSRTVIESLRGILLGKGIQKNKLFFEKY